MSYGTASVLSPERSGLILEFFGCYYFSQLEKGQASHLSGILSAPDQNKPERKGQGRDHHPLDGYDSLPSRMKTVAENATRL